MLLSKKATYLMVIGGLFTLASCFMYADIVREEGVQSTDQYTHNEAENNQRTYNNAHGQFMNLRALLPYIFASGTCITIAAILFGMGGDQNQGSKIDPAGKKITADIMIREAQPLSELPAKRFEELHTLVWTAQEQTKFKEIIENIRWQRSFKYDPAQPLAWITHVDSDLLVKQFSQEELNFLHQLIAKIKVQLRRKK